MTCTPCPFAVHLFYELHNWIIYYKGVLVFNVPVIKFILTRHFLWFRLLEATVASSDAKFWSAQKLVIIFAVHEKKLRWYKFAWPYNKDTIYLVCVLSTFCCVFIGGRSDFASMNKLGSNRSEHWFLLPFVEYFSSVLSHRFYCVWFIWYSFQWGKQSTIVARNRIVTRFVWHPLAQQ